MTISGVDHHVTASIGVACTLHSRIFDPQELYRAADAALYRVDVKSGSVSQPTAVGKIYDGRLTADGAELFFISGDIWASAPFSPIATGVAEPILVAGAIATRCAAYEM